jgi:hypothetical protein
MDRDITIHGLLRLRSEMAGQISHLEIQVDKLRADLLHVDATLRILGHIGEESSLPIRKACTAGIFHRKELARLIVGHLRDSNGMVASELAVAISRDKGWETDDVRFQKSLVEKISRAMTKMKARGLIHCQNEDRGYVWRLVG